MSQVTNPDPGDANSRISDPSASDLGACDREIRDLGGSQPGAEKRAAFVVHRQLEGLTAGNDTYLMLCLKAARAGGYRLDIVFTPEESFCNRPFARIAPDFAAIADVHWPGAIRTGDIFVSLSPKVWMRSIWRIGLEALRRLGVGITIRSRLGDVPSQGDLAGAARIIARLKPDVVVADYSSLAPIFRLSHTARVRAVILHDLFSRRAASFRAAGRKPDHTEITLDEEAARVAQATHLFYASRDEMAAFAPLTPRQTSLWMRPSVRPNRAARRDQDPMAVFVGTNHAGNRDALQHLLEDIWPLVLARLPQARLRVVGKISETIVGPLPRGVTAEGPVADLAALAGPDMVGLAPTRLASGISIKVADYLALGQPVVSYPAGVEGFGDALARAVCVARTPDAFANELVDLLGDAVLRRARSNAGLELVEHLFSATGVEEAFATPAPQASAA